MKLLNSQKNQLFEIIKNHDFFSPNQFKYEEKTYDKGRWITTIKFKDSDYHFKIFEDAEGYILGHVNFSPGINKYREVTSRIAFEGIIKEFDKWLYSLINEVQNPNLWESFRESLNNYSTELSFSDNTRFTAREFLVLQSQINELTNKLSSLPLLIEHQNQINIELQRVTQLALDLGKFDWMNLFVGTLMSIIIQLGVTKENANSIWLIVKQIFNNYFIK